MRHTSHMNRFVTATAACLLALGLNASAVILAIGDSRDLGLIDPNHPANETASEGFVDILLSQPLGTGPTTIGDNAYTRTNNNPLAIYPAADFSIEPSVAANGNVDLGTGYLYLLAKYDGPNYGSVVWYIGGLTGTNTIPTTAGGFGISHTFLFNPGVGPNPQGNNVPDGGATLLLLGTAMTGLGLARRYLLKA